MTHTRSGTVPPPYEILTLKTLAKERRARAVELIEASGGKIPRDQCWMILQRLCRRGAIRIQRRVVVEEFGQACPVYELTGFGHRVLKAVAILEGE